MVQTQTLGRSYKMDRFKQLIRIHPSFTQVDDVARLCQPLEKLGITHFSHINVTKDGEFSFMALNPKFLEAYLDHSFQNFDVFQLSPVAQEQFYLRDTQALTGKTKQLHELFNEHGFGHSFTIARSSPEMIDFYNFGTWLGNSAINEKYLQNLDSLRMFISYYHDQVNSHKDLKQSYQISLPLKSACSGFQVATPTEQQTLDIAPLSRVYIPGTNTYLTLRECECLDWLAKGKTQDEIAIILNISLRTVKAHLLTAKDKLRCVNQFQLGLAFADLKW